jgi:23S rRNA pseudouridine955/2504/2580 synthase
MSNIVTNIVSADESTSRLDRWFKRHYPSLTHSALQKLLRKGLVRVNGNKIPANYRVLEEQEISIKSPELLIGAFKTSNITSKASYNVNDDRLRKELLQSIIYKDDAIIALNKPSGVAVQGGSKVNSHIDGVLGSFRFGLAESPRLVHRLDKDTAGVLLLARTMRAAQELTEQFRKREIKKVYWAVVVGNPKLDFGVINTPIQTVISGLIEQASATPKIGKLAVTHFKVLANASNKVSWLALQPVTGRKHQVRVHCSSEGIPILGDGKYGGRAAFIKDLPKTNKVHLLARSITLELVSKRELRIVAPLPPHMKETFEYFGFFESDSEMGHDFGF